ncbi:hypothetical protein QA596_03420 [Balneolales bacterium ANBcel1]|nr:hypothetical protein [Balneolales bacterium ANBcel1]
MLSPLMGKRPRHKRFEYQYRYYKPKPGRTDRIKFRRLTRRGTAGSILLYAALLFLILWIIS